jgi:enolase
LPTGAVEDRIVVADGQAIGANEIDLWAMNVERGASTMETKITAVHAREILDSRGQPTVEADITLADGSVGRAAVPSGASTGRREAVELRDRQAKRFGGRGVLQAINHVNDEIARGIVGLDASEQKRVDQRLIEIDGSQDKSRLGANALLSVSMAVARAAAASRRQPLYEFLARSDDGHRLPVPMFNVINGGAHAANPLDFEDFMLVPHGAASFKEAVRCGAEVFYVLQELLKRVGHITAVGDEGGYAAEFWTPEEALATMVAAIERAGYRPGKDVSLAIDVAASKLHERTLYAFHKSSQPSLTTEEMIALFERLTDRFPILSIEDGLAEDDWAGWQELTADMGDVVMLVGDDLFATHANTIQRGIDEHVANAVLIKPNQVGTVSETLDAIRVSHAGGYRTVISHRSGETEDTFIADLAVAAGSAFIKTGSLARSERVAKYNQLIRIEERLGSSARFGMSSVGAATHTTL